MTKTRCPVCGNPTQPDHAPFCSRGCKDRDLLQWLGGGYRIPGPAIDPVGDTMDHPGLDSDADPD